MVTVDKGTEEGTYKVYYKVDGKSYPGSEFRLEVRVPALATDIKLIATPSSEVYANDTVTIRAASIPLEDRTYSWKTSSPILTKLNLPAEGTVAQNSAASTWKVDSDVLEDVDVTITATADGVSRNIVIPIRKRIIADE